MTEGLFLAVIAAFLGLLIWAMVGESQDCKNSGGKMVVIAIVPIVHNMNGQIFVNMVPQYQCQKGIK